MLFLKQRWAYLPKLVSVFWKKSCQVSSVSLSPKEVCFIWGLGSGWLTLCNERVGKVHQLVLNSMIFYTYFASDSPRLGDIHTISSVLDQPICLFPNHI